MYSRGAINGDLINVFAFNDGAFLFEDLAGAGDLAIEADNWLAVSFALPMNARIGIRPSLASSVVLEIGGTAPLALRARLHTAQQVIVEATARLRVSTGLAVVMAWLRPSTSRVVVKRDHRTVLVPPQDLDTP